MDKILKHLTSSQEIKFAAPRTSHIIFFSRLCGLSWSMNSLVYIIFQGSGVQGEKGYQVMNDETMTVHSPFAKTLTQL